MEKMNGLDLFSGIGGKTIALSPWVRPVAYCEIEPWAQRLLLRRMASGELPRAPIWDDVRTLKAKDLPRIDFICGGFPCQDISTAGTGRGLGGSRSGLFFEIARLAQETKAPFVFLENVPAIRTRGLKEVVRALSKIGYDCRWTNVSAAFVGAPHKRERWFLLAHSNEFASGYDRQRVTPTQATLNALVNGEPWAKADSNGVGLKTKHQLSGEPKSLRRGQKIPHHDLHGFGEQATTAAQEGPAWGRKGDGRPEAGPLGDDWWAVEPRVGRMAHGIPNRVDRLRGLGNAVVPKQTRDAFAYLVGIH